MPQKIVNVIIEKPVELIKYKDRIVEVEVEKIVEVPKETTISTSVYVSISGSICTYLCTCLHSIDSRSVVAVLVYGLSVSVARARAQMKVYLLFAL
jgi:hypothetical protein